jgi:dolichol-phosphate mannosyltransferase
MLQVSEYHDSKESLQPREITVIVLTWNEVGAIGKVVDELKQIGYTNILVVDGYSTDGTAEVARLAGAKVILQTGKGKTGALATAIRYVETPYVLVMDGDFTYDPSCIPDMTSHAAVYDEIIGARTRGRENISFFNRIGNSLLSWFFKVMFAVNLTDVCSGMYLLRSDRVRLFEFTTGGFDVVEIAAQDASNGKITEVPVNYRPRIGRKKLSSVRHGMTIGSSILRLANAHNPVVLYSSFIALSGVPALIILSWVAYERLFKNLWHTGYALFGVMLLLLSLQSLAVGTISILVKRSEQRIMRFLTESETSRTP